ncbi:TAXI family TRAP transporter solute-binding subunit [Halomonas sp. BL6]|uniref:TAXI family TRAP transporter solute-binding subunit n=1 Tax=Halomonas sp. BL6 TaxID=2585770 RepID=UPI0011190093|nr:TAXI family TRAP transporter solute-binding subunit [Halomonas sp. BL6]TNH14124.1 TAXI family TRAP transporter solute-binding subunit [Halomonas sp. BL6]
MTFKTLIATTTLASTLAFSMSQVQAQTLRAESGNPATFNSQLATLMSTLVGRYHNLDIQLSTGQNLAMTGVKLGTGRIDMTMIPSELYSYMSQGERMYSKMGDQAVNAAENLRSLFGFVHGAYHVFTWADSNIESWDDLAGKNVYIGPSASAASSVIEQVILANTGMQPDEGYNAVTMGWGASGQAFTDGQVDVMVSAPRIGSSAIEQFSLVEPIRFLGMTQEGMQSDTWQELMATPGMLTAEISSDTYSNTVNEEEHITLLAFTMMALVHKNLDEETAYQITSTLWDNIDEIRDSRPTFDDLVIEDAFIGVNAPLHPGAYRYYQEQGIDVPAQLIPSDD